MLKGFFLNFKTDILRYFFGSKAKPFMLPAIVCVISLIIYCGREYLKVFLNINILPSIGSFELYCYIAAAAIVLFAPFCLLGGLNRQIDDMSDIFQYSEQRRGYLVAARFVSNTVIACAAFAVGVGLCLLQSVLIFKSVDFYIFLKLTAGSMIFLVLNISAFSFLSSLKLSKSGTCSLLYFFFMLLGAYSLFGGVNLIDTIYRSNIIYFLIGAGLSGLFLISGYLYIKYTKTGGRVI